MGLLEEKINELSVLEQSIQQFASQKKNFQVQLVEVESALKEINEDSFKIIGNFMFRKNQQDLKEELQEKRNLLNVRIKSFEKHEKETETKFKELQSQVLKELSKKK